MIRLLFHGKARMINGLALLRRPHRRARRRYPAFAPVMLPASRGNHVVEDVGPASPPTTGDMRSWFRGSTMLATVEEASAISPTQLARAALDHVAIDIKGVAGRRGASR